MNQTPNYSRTRDSITLIAVAILAVIILMATSSCSTERGGCRLTRGYVGYGSR